VKNKSVIGYADFYRQEEAEQDNITKLVNKINIFALISQASAL
jgi:hypothetical protein